MLGVQGGRKPPISPGAIESGVQYEGDKTRRCPSGAVIVFHGTICGLLVCFMTVAVGAIGLIGVVASKVFADMSME